MTNQNCERMKREGTNKKVTDNKGKIYEREEKVLPIISIISVVVSVMALVISIIGLSISSYDFGTKIRRECDMKHEQKMPYNKSGIDIKSVEALKTQSDTYEIHDVEVSGDASTGTLLEVTTESDFQYSIRIGDYVGIITESKNVYWGRVDFFDDKSLVLQSEEIGIATSIPYSVITHINSRWI